MARTIKVMPTPANSEIANPHDIAAFVRARRTQSNLRIDDTAALCGVSVETLSKIETAKGGVTVDSLFKVLAGLGIQLKVAPW